MSAVIYVFCEHYGQRPDLHFHTGLTVNGAVDYVYLGTMNGTCDCGGSMRFSAQRPPYLAPDLGWQDPPAVPLGVPGDPLALSVLEAERANLAEAPRKRARRQKPPTPTEEK